MQSRSKACRCASLAVLNHVAMLMVPCRACCPALDVEVHLNFSDEQVWRNDLQSAEVILAGGVDIDSADEESKWCFISHASASASTQCSDLCHDLRLLAQNNSMAWVSHIHTSSPHIFSTDKLRM